MTAFAVAPPVRALIRKELREYRHHRMIVMTATVLPIVFLILPMAKLQELFMARKINELEAEAKKMAVVPRSRYINFETRFNDAGYKLLNDKQTEGALYIFGLNTRLFPKSANAWDSYAEAHWKTGKMDKAIEYYNKAIELDPDGDTGRNAREMLKQVMSEKGK